MPCILIVLGKRCRAIKAMGAGLLLWLGAALPLMGHPADWENVTQVRLTSTTLLQFERSISVFQKHVEAADAGQTVQDLPPLDQILGWSDEHIARANGVALHFGFVTFERWKSTAHSLGLAYQHLTVGSEADEMERQMRAAIKRLELDTSIAEVQRRDIILSLREQLAQIRRPLPENLELLKGQIKRFAPFVEVPAGQADVSSNR